MSTILVNTKPFSDALTLSVVNSNVSKYYSKSCMAQLILSGNNLRLNFEANQIRTEVLLKGDSDAKDITEKAVVDCLLLKQIVSTFDTNTCSVEFVEGGIILHSGKSNFTLPNIVDITDLELDRPDKDNAAQSYKDISHEFWTFIRDKQMYAIAMSFIHPVYTNVWVGDTGDVLTGDIDNSIFTYSGFGDMPETCLLSDTIINLLVSLPDSAQIKQVGDGKYLTLYACDSFDLVCQFSPKYEDDPDVGSYSSDVILDMMNDKEEYIEFETKKLKQLLGQIDILASTSDNILTISTISSEGRNFLNLQDKNVSGDIPYTGNIPDFTMKFKSVQLKQMIYNYDEDKLYLCPRIVNDECVGLLVWSDDLTSVLGCVEE